MPRGLDLGTRSELSPSRSGRFHLGARDAGIIEYEDNRPHMKGKSFPRRESNLVAEPAVSPYRVYAGLLTEHYFSIIQTVETHIIKQTFCSRN